MQVMMMMIMMMMIMMMFCSSYMQCEVEKKGRIFFPDFCKLCLRKFREFDEENFRQELFKVNTEQTFRHHFEYNLVFTDLKVS